MPRIFLLSLFLSIPTYALIPPSHFQIRKPFKIENLKAENIDVIFKGEKIRIFRSFTKNGRNFLLAINLKTSDTFLLSTSEFKKYKILSPKEFLKTNFGSRIQKLKEMNNPYSHGHILTIDLCAKPKNKSKKFEMKFFEWLTEFQPHIAIAISAKWINEEKENFAKLLNWKQQGLLKIIWINHSVSHPINNGKFLTEGNISLKDEILQTEQMLLEHNQIPSVFFRFPGLISNQNLIKELAEFSLISISANAWLAKGEHITHSSIILVHGNGNEPLGILKLKKYFEQKRPSFLSILEGGDLF
jgi:hypothetical protein